MLSILRRFFVKEKPESSAWAMANKELSEKREQLSSLRRYLETNNVPEHMYRRSVTAILDARKQIKELEELVTFLEEERKFEHVEHMIKKLNSRKFR